MERSPFPSFLLYLQNTRNRIERRRLPDEGLEKRMKGWKEEMNRTGKRPLARIEFKSFLLRNLSHEP
jgi:hypothetical protein